MKYKVFLMKIHSFSEQTFSMNNFENELNINLLKMINMVINNLNKIAFAHILLF